MRNETLVSSEEYKGYTVEIHIDTDPWHPRTDCDNFGTMVCFHSRYHLGDKHEYSSDTIKEELAIEA